MSQSRDHIQKTEPRTAADRDELLGHIAEEFESRVRQGECPLIAEYVDRFPDLSTDIETLFPTILTLEGIKADSARDQDGRVSLSGNQIEQLGEFRIEREISRGGMGVVFEAEQVSLQRRVAIKVLPRRTVIRPEVRERFDREARLAASLHHSNIVPIHGCGLENGYQFYAMQLIEGTSLDRLGDKCLSANRVAEIGVQVADALEYAHEQDVLHRDVKPSNLIEDADGRIWITDFGLAISSSNGVRDGIGGTEKYMAPERADGICEAPADVFSLGTTLQALLSKQDSRFVSRDLTAVLRRATTHDWENRYQSPGELAEELRRFLNHEPVKARRLSWLGRTAKMFRRNPALSVCLTVLFAFAWSVAIVSYYSFLRSEKQNAVLLHGLFSIDGLMASNNWEDSKLDYMAAFNDERAARYIYPAPEESKMRGRFLPKDRVAELFRTSPEMIPMAASVRRSVGRALEYLGKQPEARRAFLFALQAAERSKSIASPGSGDSISATLSMAEIQSDVARVLEKEFKLEEAECFWRDALRTLSDVPSTDRNRKAFFRVFSSAQIGLSTFHPEKAGLFGTWFELDRQKNDFSQDAMAAMERLGEVLQYFGASDVNRHPPYIKIMFARALIERVRWKNMLGQQSLEDGQRAVELMRELTTNAPRNSRYRYVYARALANVQLPEKPITASELKQLRLRLERALALIHSLTRSLPRRVSYHELEVDIRHQLAELAIRCTAEGDVESDFEIAVTMQNHIIKNLPTGISDHIRQTLLQWRFADWLAHQGMPDRAEGFREQSRRFVELIPPERLSHPCIVAVREVISGKRVLRPLSERVKVEPEPGVAMR